MINNHKRYTIQISASKQRLNLKQFAKIDGVREIASDDGYYRYVCGDYSSFAEAQKALGNIKKTGLDKAFIRDFNTLLDK